MKKRGETPGSVRQNDFRLFSAPAALRPVLKSEHAGDGEIRSLRLFIRVRLRPRFDDGCVSSRRVLR